MTKNEVAQTLVDMGINADTISFYVDEEGDSPDTNFGTCELSGIKGAIVDCAAHALDESGVVYFRAGEWLVGGALGKLAGAF